MPILATIRGLVRTIVHAHERMSACIPAFSRIAPPAATPTHHRTATDWRRPVHGGEAAVGGAVQGVQAARRAGGRNSVGG